MIDAAIHSSYLRVVHIGNKRAETNTDHPWLKYSGRNGRMNSQQMDLAHSLMEKELLMDCPDVANFKKPKLRPRYGRRKDYHPCECGNCFFCKYRITYGVQRKKPKAPMFRVPLPGQPESPQVPPPPPSQHLKKRIEVARGYCDVCIKREKMKQENEGMTLKEISKLPNCHSARHGCPLCNMGEGVRVCPKCWKTYTHDL
jgi:hypothetical protein